MPKKRQALDEHIPNSTPVTVGVTWTVPATQSVGRWGSPDDPELGRKLLNPRTQLRKRWAGWLECAVWPCTSPGSQEGESGRDDHRNSALFLSLALSQARAGTPSPAPRAASAGTAVLV